METRVGHILVFLALVLCCQARSNARLVKILSHSSTVLSPAATQLGMSSRALTIDSINQMKRGEREAAMESLNQAITTLAVLDVAGAGVVQNPFTALAVNYIAEKREFANVKRAIHRYNTALYDGLSQGQPLNKKGLLSKVDDLRRQSVAQFQQSVENLPRNSKILKNLNNAAKWSKLGTALDAFGALFDVFAIGINAWGFDIARRDGNVAGMASAGIGIAAGVIGAGTFVLALYTGSAVLGPAGALAGAVLGLVATLIDIFSSNPSSEIESTIKTLKKLTDSCKKELGQTSRFMKPLSVKYGVGYESNPANMIDVKGMPDEPLLFQPGKGIGNRLLGAGKIRRLDLSAFSNAYWDAEGKADIGYDFYGKIIHKNERGVSVFLNTKFVAPSGTPLRGVSVQTFADGYQNHFVHDQVSIEDFENLKKGEKIIINTGYGNDVIAVNGLIGKFTADFGDVLDVTTGTADNELTFGGISKKHSKIKGIYFNRITERAGFYHGGDRTLHEFGTVRGIVLVRGSPFNDHVVLHGEGFRVEQSHGRNIYEIDVTQANPDQDRVNHVIVDASNSPAKILVVHSGNVMEENFSYHNKTLTISMRRGDDPWTPVRVIRLGCKEEPYVDLVENGRITKKGLILSWMKKYQFDGQIYRFQFYNDRTGTRRDDVFEILAPRSGPTSSHTIDGGEGHDYIMITKDLLDVYSISPGSRTLHLKHRARDWVLEIRDTASSRIKHDVIIKNAEEICNEEYEPLIDLSSARGNEFDLASLNAEVTEVKNVAQAMFKRMLN
ncbi:uncharacterized protein LOC116610394 isoform X1 [Nematostella vectensis]|uniref:uncharacterized protein LOC116610394 isoform X1 n=1 Tax=Nematostella vectensis TaxID=45351 RepID=UPI0020774FDA|nr:uncharacterized protein LOC116610394 isoform X1 [Nematostella vectensis]